MERYNLYYTRSFALENAYELEEVWFGEYCISGYNNNEQDSIFKIVNAPKLKILSMNTYTVYQTNRVVLANLTALSNFTITNYVFTYAKYITLESMIEYALVINIDLSCF